MAKTTRDIEDTFELARQLLLRARDAVGSLPTGWQEKFWEAMRNNGCPSSAADEYFHSAKVAARRTDEMIDILAMEIEVVRHCVAYGVHKTPAAPGTGSHRYLVLQ